MLVARRGAAERVWHATKDALDPAAPSFLAGTEIAEGSARQAAALLVLELAYADPVLTPDRPRGGGRASPIDLGHRGRRAAERAGADRRDPTDSLRGLREATATGRRAGRSGSSWWSASGPWRSATERSGSTKTG